MKEIQVKFESAEEISEFVNIVKNYPGDMDLKSGRFVVDAKSILGIMNIGIQKIIKLTVAPESYDEIKVAVDKYVFA